MWGGGSAYYTQTRSKNNLPSINHGSRSYKLTLRIQMAERTGHDWRIVTHYCSRKNLEDKCLTWEMTEV